MSPPRHAGHRGEPVEPATRRRVETATGEDLSAVRVHTDPASRAWVDGLGALGATVGTDVALGSGAQEGLTRETVLAHELAHTAQSRGVSHRGRPRLDADTALESDADAVASAAVTGGHRPVGHRAQALGLHRCKDDVPPAVRKAADKADPAKLQAFRTMAKGGVPAEDAAEKLQLPTELVDAMAEAWKNSFPGGHSKEQGGVLVRRSDGTLDFVKATSTTSGSATMPWGSLPSGATPLAAAHTHPYDAAEGGHQGVMFSGGDLGNLVTDPAAVKVVHAGDRYFTVAKTKEFEDTVAAKSAADRTAYAAAIRSEWATLFGSSSGDVAARARAATTAICRTYRLTLYEGTLTGEMSRVAVTP